MDKSDRKKYSVIDWKLIVVFTILIIIGVFIIGLTQGDETVENASEAVTVVSEVE